MLKKIVLSFFICAVFYCALNSQTVPNIGRQVYGLYSDIFLGAVYGAANNIDDDSVSLSYISNCNSASQPYSSRYRSSIPISSITVSDGSAYEGSSYLRFSPKGTNPQAFLISFNPSSYGNVYPGNSRESDVGERDMSAYYGGVIKFFAKNLDANTGNDATQIGIRIGASTDKQTKVSPDLAVFTDTYTWKECTMYLVEGTGGGKLNVSSTDLRQVSTLFSVYFPDDDGNIDVDNILWIKPNPVLNSASFSLALKNAADDSAADKITFSTASWTPVSKGGWTVSMQYIEVDPLDYFKQGWSAQIYTNNAAAGVSSPLYSGTFAASSVSGMINTANNGEILPMRWRVMKESDVTGGILIYDPSWQNPWSSLRDISAYQKGDEQIKFYDRRGYKWDSYNVLYGLLPANKKLRIYFLADMDQAKRGFEYRTNSIIIEYFTE
jgi:hypothetical protein